MYTSSDQTHQRAASIFVSWNHMSHGNDTILFYYYAFSATFTSNAYTERHSAALPIHKLCIRPLSIDTTRTHFSFSLHLSLSLTEVMSDTTKWKIRLLPHLVALTQQMQFLISHSLHICAWMHPHYSAIIKTTWIYPPKINMFVKFKDRSLFCITQENPF